MSNELNDNDEPEAVNPYASPQFAPETATIVAPYELRKTVRAYRAQWHILGATWIIMGICGFVISGFIVYHSLHELRGLRHDILAMILGGVSAGWFLLGIATCGKQLVAVHMGLVLSYLVLLLSVVTLSLCFLVILLPVIIQAHRVLSWAKYIQLQGLPIAIRVRDIETHIIVPPQ
jgi:hypothetical protein